MARILLVDDEALILNVLSTLLKAEGYEVVTTSDGGAAMEILEKEDFDLLMSDIRMKPIDGMQLLRHCHENKPSMPVIMLTAYASMQTATEALKLGAFDYITKPFKIEQVVVTVQRALNCTQHLRINEYLRDGGESIYRFGDLVAKSPEMRELCGRIEQIALARSNILMCGERGTGKQQIARAIHEYGPGKDKEFASINCAELPEPFLDMELFGMSGSGGLFAAAAGGTLMLDEIGMMPPALQEKLLALLHDKTDGAGETRGVQIIASVLSDVDALVRDGIFHKELFEILSAVRIEIKPLRERREDILPLMSHVVHMEIGEGGEMPVLSPEIPVILEKYDWPGNVAELVNVVKGVLADSGGGEIRKELLPAKILEATGAGSGGKGGDLGRGDFWAKSLKAYLRQEIEKSRS